MLGVNLAGGEFGSGQIFNTNYTYPTIQEVDYYDLKGFDVLRVPFKISRLMPDKAGGLDDDVTRLETLVDYAETKGITVVLDAHDYGAAWGSAIGTGTTTYQEFGRFWGLMAERFKDDAVFFGLMNEPNSQSATQWAPANQAAIDAIRATGATQKILVPGTYWDGAHSWVSSDNDTVIGLTTTDPLNNYAFEVHQYLDGNSSGTSATAVSETIGVERLTSITEWARAHGKELFLGEFGAADNPTALAALDNMVRFMDQNTDVWIGATAWAGGPWWNTSYPFALDPTDLKTAGPALATDRPQIDILETYDLEAPMALPRVFISHDGWFGSDEKDDWQSLIHALMFQDKIDIQGISATGSRWGGQQKVADTWSVIDTYGLDRAALSAHAAGFKSIEALKASTYQGKIGVQPSAGWSTPTASSQAIIKEAKEAGALGQKLNVLAWGGVGDIAQALHDDPSIAPHVRLFNISEQDPYAMKYIAANFKGKLDMWVDDRSTFRGTYQNPDTIGRDLPIDTFHATHAKGHGALGNLFHDLSLDIFGHAGVKMGDSPTIFRFLSGNQNDPGAESWGGEFTQVSPRYWRDKTDDALDFDRSGTDGAMTVYEDRAAWLNSFRDRFDWLTATEPPGTGDDTVTVTVSGDDYLGDPNFSLVLDGKVIDSTNLVTADHDAGQWQTFTFTGEFDAPGTQSHKLEVKFTNDKWGGSADLDRNLYIDRVTLNGAANDTDVTLTRTGTKLYWFEV